MKCSLGDKARLLAEHGIAVIMEKNMKNVCRANVKIVEFVNTKNNVMRMCAPVF